jgi:hypothetical protein
VLIGSALPACSAESHWVRHVIHEGEQAMTAVAGDFSGDGLPDVISDSGGMTRLFVAPDWQEVVLYEHPEFKWYIHSESFDVDNDGDLDYIAARYNPGQVVWLEQPAHALTERWQTHLIDETIHGIHGLMKGDIGNDGQWELFATSAQPKEPYPESLVWFAVPENPRQAGRWKLKSVSVISMVMVFSMRQQEPREGPGQHRRGSGLPGGSHPWTRRAPG